MSVPKNIRIGTSPLSGSIFAGTLLKGGRMWSANKTDVTNEAIGAVIEHVNMQKNPVIVSVNGVPTYEILVRRLAAGELA
ncbi:DUF7446 family protein [Glaciimonas immobilis]|uniref:Uncharacterized protein n=1 Tax=Glaciimonas immobilis TaxID=728004 RepID=A0A840RVA8_9BURK|nr:hypothetical protein [Glaciimonas immobilis]KAF3997497.1 hypothetical protein HAV38_12515 [Glaciimonas immobilis]MBB5200826.1 hypothetical protein [Glaciimonas immobilis]